MRKLYLSLAVSVLLVVFGRPASLLSQEVTPAPPEQQAAPRTPPPATPSDTNPAPSPAPTATATKVLAAAPVETPAPDLTVLGSKPQKVKAVEPLPPPPASEAVTPSTEVAPRTMGSLTVSLLLGGVLLAAAGLIVFRVIRRRRNQAVHLLDPSFHYSRTPLSTGRRI